MPNQWSAEDYQKLLVYAIDAGTVKISALAELWVKEEGAKETVGAVTQRLQKLRKKKGLGTASSNGGTPRKTTNTPRKTATSTPGKKSASRASASGTKRGRRSMSDEDDDDEPTTHSGSESPSKRAKMERRSKTPKSYAAPESDDDEDLLANHGSTNESGADGVANGEVGDLDEDDDAFEPAFH
ncbi:hypothetical protein LTR97_001788 [Elasticomyces elasticus]|uniref:Uncharacterized protein n=1 Tax=Elasticomyces elasticus TaxID=574655 RepID=A0AAN8A589_9PEZI|nr:hypothetical protein LTR97_001788 [Elasticomyces elasticus]